MFFVLSMSGNLIVKTKNKKFNENQEDFGNEKADDGADLGAHL